MNGPHMLYKTLQMDGSRLDHGKGKWSVPVDDQPGEWTPEFMGKLWPGMPGYRLYRETDLLYHLGPAIWEAEYDGDLVEYEHAVVVRKARLVRRVLPWDDRIARLFACDCAEHVLPIFETHRPNCGIPRKTIEVARRYANGQADRYDSHVASEAALLEAGRSGWDGGAAASAAHYAAFVGAPWMAARLAAAAAVLAEGGLSGSEWAKEWPTTRLFEYLLRCRNN